MKIAGVHLAKSKKKTEVETKKSKNILNSDQGLMSPFTAFREVFGTQILDSEGRVFYKLKKLGKKEISCPFCNKKKLVERGEYIGEIQFDRDNTGNYIWKETPDPTSDYMVMVVKNIFPIIQNKNHKHSLHFVIIESNAHLTEFHKLSQWNIKGAIMSYIELMKKYHEEHAAVILYKNQGTTAQSSQSHVHSQIIFLDSIPSRIISTLSEIFLISADEDKCLMCERTKDLIENKPKIVLKVHDHWITYCPKHIYPFVIRLLPKRHVPDLLALNEEEINELAKILKLSTNRLIGNFGNIDYNILWHQAPRVYRSRWHFFIEIVPRGVNEPAGFEMLTGIRITETPEAAADALRDIKNKCVMCGNYYYKFKDFCPYCGYNKVNLSYEF
ncbi:MAG: galactose-1-phosphate uridylyltransferase [Candidatus Helarchaeota archaeon]